MTIKYKVEKNMTQKSLFNYTDQILDSLATFVLQDEYVVEIKIFSIFNAAFLSRLVQCIYLVKN